MGIGLKIPTTPITRHILKRLEPTTFPTEISLSPLAAATAEVASSGRDVPKATTEIPINVWDRPISRAIIIASRTTKFAPKESIKIPKMIKTTFFTIVGNDGFTI